VTPPSSLIGILWLGVWGVGHLFGEWGRLSLIFVNCKVGYAVGPKVVINFAPLHLRVAGHF